MHGSGDKRERSTRMFSYINYVMPFISSYAEKALMINDAMGYCGSNFPY